MFKKNKKIILELIFQNEIYINSMETIYTHGVSQFISLHLENNSHEHFF